MSSLLVLTIYRTGPALSDGMLIVRCFIQRRVSSRSFIIYTHLPLSCMDSDMEASVRKYALQNASNYQFFMDEWKTFADIQKSLVKPVQHPSQLLSTAGSTIVMNDSVTTNILYIKQFLLTGQQKPYEYAKEEIKEILLNRRKIEFLQQLETAIYNDALQGGEIIYYQ